MIQTRWGARALAVLVSVSLTAACVPRQPVVVFQPVALIALHMASPTTGWALTPHAVLHSTDGGRQWRDVSPLGYRPTPNLSNLFNGATTFLDANTAWVAWWQPGQKVAIRQTRDDGHTWAAYHLTPFARPSAEAGNPLQLLFRTPQDGWLVVGGEGLMGYALVVLRTTDGGAHWTRMAALSSIAGLLGFRTATMGWGMSTPASIPPARFIYRTQDGGRSWQKQRLPVPSSATSSSATYDLIHFATTQDGLLPTLLSSRAGLMLETYGTHDGGQSWQATPPLVLPPPATTVLTSFVGRANGWALGLDNRGQATGFYTTGDGAQHWQAVQPTVRLHDVDPLAFVSARVGFALVGPPWGRGLLLVTDDGGHTWHARHPQLVP